MHLKENTVFDLGVKVTQNVTQHPLHHGTFTPAKFEVAKFKALRDAYLPENTVLIL